MKTLLKKTNDAVVLFAFFLLGTVGISAQTYQDDVYYSPSKDTSKKVEKPKSVKKEVKRTYRANEKAEDFSAAQEKYAKMLREKQEDSNYPQNVHEEEVTWVEDTQGLKPKHEIQKEVSLYNTGDVNADDPQADAYYEDNYVLWQPTTVTRVYAQPRFYSNFYFGFNFGWGGAYYNPYYTHYYDPFYWDYYYSPYWGNPFYYGYSPFYTSWYHPYAGWRHHYYTPYYYRDSYYYTKYYRDYYTYSQRPREYSNRSKNSRRQSLISDRRKKNNSSAKAQRVRAENMNRRYSALAGNRKNTDNSSVRRSSKTHDSRLSTDRNDVRRRNPSIQDNKTNNTVKRRVSRNTVHQGKAPYVRRIEKSSTNYRRSTATPKQSVNKPNKNSRVYKRSTPQEYRRMNSNRNIRRSTPTIYRKTTSPRKTNNSSIQRKTTPRKVTNYRSTPSRTRVKSTPTRSTSVRSSTPQRTRTTSPSRTTRTRNRR